MVYSVHTHSDSSWITASHYRYPLVVYLVSSLDDIVLLMLLQGSFASLQRVFGQINLMQFVDQPFRYTTIL